MVIYYFKGHLVVWKIRLKYQLSRGGYHRAKKIIRISPIFPAIIFVKNYLLAAASVYRDVKAFKNSKAALVSQRKMENGRSNDVSYILAANI